MLSLANTGTCINMSNYFQVDLCQRYQVLAIASKPKGNPSPWQRLERVCMLAGSASGGLSFVGLGNLPQAG